MPVEKEKNNLNIDWKAWDSVILDAGCGVGLFALTYAKEHPETLVLAVERTHERSSKLLRRAENHQLKNLYAVQADVMEWMKEGLPDQCLNQLYFLYPNPWPKLKHKKRRYLFHPLWSEVERCLVPGGELVIASNIESYIDEAYEALQANSKFEALDKQRLSPDQNGRTHFERKYLKRGEPCWDLRAKVERAAKESSLS